MLAFILSNLNKTLIHRNRYFHIGVKNKNRMEMGQRVAAAGKEGRKGERVRK